MGMGHHFKKWKVIKSSFIIVLSTLLYAMSYLLTAIPLVNDGKFRPPIFQDELRKRAAAGGTNISAWEWELVTRLDRIRTICGDLCTINDRETYERYLVPVEGANFPMLSVPNVDCSAILMSEDIDASDYTYPFPPPDLLDKDFTMGGMIQSFHGTQMKDGYLGLEGKMSNWSLSFVETQLEKLKLPHKNAENIRGSYGARGSRIFYDKIQELDLKDKDILVIGSERPWIEVICLHFGARHVTTLEYGNIASEHPQLRTMTPVVFRREYQKGTLPKFDVVISHSSLEHCGLGRYGDALNPWGDILAMARAWCVAKPQAKLYLGLPTGKDCVIHNSNRVYGRIRWPLVTANWKQIDGNKHSNEEFEDDHLNGKFKRRFGGQGFLFERVGD
jgi:hypothetical protein